MNKYISTKDAVRLTGLSTQEIYDLIHEGKLPAHKAPKSGRETVCSCKFIVIIAHS